MSDESNLICGPYRVDALGTVTIISRGDGTYLRAAGDDGDLGLQAGGSISMTTGSTFFGLESGGKAALLSETGTIEQRVGPKALGPRIELTADAITLAIGPPGAGTSITLGPTSITLQVGIVKLALSPTGIEEAVAATTRKAALTGHQLTAAESTLKVGLEGVSTDAPLLKQTAEGVAQLKATVFQLAVDGIKKDHAGVTMLG